MILLSFFAYAALIARCFMELSVPFRLLSTSIRSLKLPLAIVWSIAAARIALEATVVPLAISAILSDVIPCSIVDALSTSLSNALFTVARARAPPLSQPINRPNLLLSIFARLSLARMLARFLSMKSEYFLFVSPTAELSMRLFAAPFAFPANRLCALAPILPIFAPMLPNEFKELCNTKGVAPNGKIDAANAATCMVSFGLFGSSVPTAANTAPANFPAPYRRDITGNTINNPLSIDTHFLNKFSVFGRSHAANANGDIAINNMTAACRTINITSTTSKAKSRAMIVGILTARNINRPTPASASPSTIKVLNVPTSAD